MPGPKCGVCDLDSSCVGALETVHAYVEKAGKTVKVSQFVCLHCKTFLEVHDENASE